jgi:DNA-binding NtrC family response regulator
VLGTQDSLEQQGSSQANAGSVAPVEAEQTIDALRRILVGRTIADVERHLILDTLTYCFGNRTHAARILGISIRTLRNKLNEYVEAGVAVPEPGQKPAVAA